MLQSIAPSHARSIAALHDLEVKRPDRTVSRDTKKREGEALKAQWDLHHADWTQARFATEVLGVSEGYLPQLFGGIRPITLAHARLFAEKLGCDIAAFSQRLAREDAAERELVQWPFRTVAYAEIAALKPWDLALLEGKITSWLLKRKAARDNRRKSRSRTA